MSKAVDMELKKAFAELQSKMVETSQHMTLADHQIDSLKKIVHHASLTDQEMQLLPEDTRAYEGIGRMFVATTVADVRSSLEKKEGSASEKIKNLEHQKEVLEKSLKEAEQNLREMVQAKRDGR